VKTWDPDGSAALVRGVPIGCRAVPLIEVVSRNGDRVEVRDRRRRLKTTDVVLVADASHPIVDVDAATRRFALGTGRRRWVTIASRYGDAAYDIAVSLVRARLVHLACQVDERGHLGPPLWWRPTVEAAEAAVGERELHAARVHAEHASARSLIHELRGSFPEVADALAGARTATASKLIIAAANDLLAGVEHAGPRAFAQAHFGETKAHDVRGVLLAAGVPDAILESLGLRRGDRIGLGGPIVVDTDRGQVALAPLRGPVGVRLDQPGLTVSTSAPLIVVLENLQPAEIVCARHPDLAVVYTAGQFGSDTAAVLNQLAAGHRVVAIVDADLGGVRIARRVLESIATAEIVDVGTWSHPERSPFAIGGVSTTGLRALVDDPLVGWFATAVLDRGYPVEQELATLTIVNGLRHG
jgi:hypothetical protein